MEITIEQIKGAVQCIDDILDGVSVSIYLTVDNYYPGENRHKWCVHVIGRNIMRDFESWAAVEQFINDLDTTEDLTIYEGE